VDNERRPKAPAEIPTKGSMDMITVPDIGPQLTRLEDVLDRILRNLAPLAGAR
jgi:hypothetical protein